MDEVSTQALNEVTILKPPSTDLGFYVNKLNLSNEVKYKLLTKPFTPSDNYDFKNIQQIHEIKTL